METLTLIKPGEAGYEQAREVWNAMIDRRPAAIARCASTHDVIAALRYARDNGLEVGVRCGGHSIVGHAVPDGGLMIDLTPLSSVTIDPSRRTARVAGGALLGALDAAAQRHGLATTAGNVSHTGVGGLTLGGGMGWLARKYGLTCDNVISYELVTAAGEIVRASVDENPELFWGLRGGGGNFGIVTEFEFRLHPVDAPALVADLSFPVDTAFSVLRDWRDLSQSAPREATFTAGISGASVSVGFVWIGDPAGGQRLLSSLRKLGKPAAETVDEMSYVRLQRIDDSPQGHTYRRYWKGHYFADFTDETIEAFRLRGTDDGRGDFLPSVSLQSYGGAIADIPDEDAAFSHRDTMFEYVAAARWSHPNEDEARMAAARQCAGALEPYASGNYVNTMGDESIKRAFPAEKLAKLTALKDQYDPTNVFHLNQNIAPSV
jgi:FAD/FMN-containing dehydrogenase